LTDEVLIVRFSCAASLQLQTVTAREEKHNCLTAWIWSERGITIKSHAIQMEYTYKGRIHPERLILLATFSYEVSHLLPLAKGTLIVDAAQSIQLKISNLYLALENDLEIIPVLNKVDLPSANPEVSDDIDLLGCKLEEIIYASGKLV
jgi:GTP-binding protein LepA